MLAAWLKKNYVFIWWSLLLLFSSPAILLLQRYRDDSLGFNPLETLMHTTGRWALIFLLASLTITPLRRGLAKFSRHMHSAYGKRLSDWNWIIRLRRMIGLYSFFYATLHLAIFMHFDIGWDGPAMLEEFQEKPYIFAGILGFLLLLPVAITSTNAMMRRLGNNWRRLHRLVYVITVLVLLHYWWQVKVGITSPVPYTVVAVYLLGYRLITHFGWLVNRPADDGMEVPEKGRHQADNERRVETLSEATSVN